MQTESQTPRPSTAGTRVEFTATIAIAVLVAFGGRSILATLSLNPGPASMLLFLIAFLQAATLLRTLRSKSEIARIAASRDITGLLAILFAIVAVLTKAKWSIGTSIAAIEFVFVLELMRLLTVSRSTR